VRTEILLNKSRHKSFKIRFIFVKIVQSASRTKSTSVKENVCTNVCLKSHVLLDFEKRKRHEKAYAHQFQRPLYHSGLYKCTVTECQ